MFIIIMSWLLWHMWDFTLWYKLHSNWKSRSYKEHFMHPKSRAVRIQLIELHLSHKLLFKGCCVTRHTWLQIEIMNLTITNLMQYFGYLIYWPIIITLQIDEKLSVIDLILRSDNRQLVIFLINYLLVTFTLYLFAQKYWRYRNESEISSKTHSVSSLTT